MEQIFATIAISAILYSGVAQAESAQKPVPTLTFPLSTENEASKQATQDGLLDLIFGWDESARLHFQNAVAHDDSNAVAYAGLCLTNPQDDEARKHLKSIYENASSSLLPHETFYIEALLKLAAGHYKAACQDFCTHADKFRADKISNIWAVILLHSADLAYHPETGEPGAFQAEALQRAEKLIANYTKDALISYARAYIEQSAPGVSADAMAAALHATEAFPHHPMPHFLMGHLLSRINQQKEAAKYFNTAATLATKRGLKLEESPLWWKLRLCEATALWSSGQTTKANKLINTINSSAISEDSRLTEVSILRRWESNTLPLRLLVAGRTIPSQRAISAASRFATPKKAWKQSDYVLHVRDCLRASLSARLKTKQGKWKEAKHSLDLAEKAKECLDQSYEALTLESPNLITPWHRALEACTIAINLAKADMYSDTEHIWLENAQRARKAPNLMLPPVIPSR